MLGAGATVRAAEPSFDQMAILAGIGQSVPYGICPASPPKPLPALPAILSRCGTHDATTD